MAVNINEYRDTVIGGFTFCGVSAEQFAINGHRYQWPRGSRLSWNLAFDRLGSLGEQDLKAANERNFAAISAVCGIDFIYTINPRTANILVALDSLDGRSGILADMEIPVGNVKPSSTMNGRIDIAERWDIFDGPGGGRIDYRRTQFH